MSRQVIRADVEVGGSRGGSDASRPSKPDDYSDRLVKLIPAETVALYISLQGIIVSGLKGEGEPMSAYLSWWLWGTVLIVLILNVLYMQRVQNVTDRKQLLWLSVAFAVWVIGSGGEKLFGDDYPPFVGSIVLALFTFMLPIVYKGVRSGQQQPDTL